MGFVGKFHLVVVGSWCGVLQLVGWICFNLGVWLPVGNGWTMISVGLDKGIYNERWNCDGVGAWM